MACSDLLRNLLNLSFLFLDPFDCGALIGCGGDAWIITNSSLLAYVKNATCSDTFATPFTSLTALNCQCPEVSIAPCTCGPTATTDGSDSKTLTVSCANQNLTDSTIADVIVKVAPTTPVDSIDFSGNRMTKIPSNITQYTRLISLSFASNQITSIISNDLNLAADNVLFLDLSNNRISSISSSNGIPGEILYT